MTTDTWFDIPGFSAYETTRDGVVRISLKNYPEDNGKLIKCYVEKLPHKTVEWYLMNTDGGNGPRAVHKDWLLLQVFGKEVKD